MPKAYSADIRGRVVAWVESGALRREGGGQFERRPSAAIKWVKCFRDTGSCGPDRAVAAPRRWEQERPDVARARRRWKRGQATLDSTQLVFIDETAANTKMVRLSGRCPHGERLVCRVPHGRR